MNIQYAGHILMCDFVPGDNIFPFAWLHVHSVMGTRTGHTEDWQCSLESTHFSAHSTIHHSSVHVYKHCNDFPRHTSPVSRLMINRRNSNRFKIKGSCPSFTSNLAYTSQTL